MEKIYDLRDDSRYIKNVQHNIPDTKKYEKAPQFGLVGSKEWWRAIETRHLLKHEITGHISRYNPMKSCSLFWLKSHHKETCWLCQRTRLKHIKQGETFKVGKAAKIIYVLSNSRHDQDDPSQIPLEIWVESPQIDKTQKKAEEKLAVNKYWKQEHRLLLDPETGALSDLPWNVTDRLYGFAMHSANRNVIKLRVLGLDKEADTLLSSYYEPLKEILNDELICEKLRKRPSIHPGLAFHLETLSVAHWLYTGEIDRIVACRAVHEIEMSNEAQGKYSGVPSSLLLALEARLYDKAEEFYSRWERKPLLKPPTNLRFSGNPRHLLMAHLRYGKDKNMTDMLSHALDKFRERAQRWYNIYADLDVNILELARLISQCIKLRGDFITFEELWKVIK